MDSVYEIESSSTEVLNTDVVLENVSITTPSGDEILAKYDKVVIPYGKKVALKGANGCGKTTLVRCLNRYYPRLAGTVTIFGKSQSEYSQKELTSLLYYSPQVSFFISGTVRENLIYGIERAVSDEELKDALLKVRLFGEHEGVLAKDGDRALDYVLTEGAKELSGGMKQRLALARAFLHTPKLFIFDEITANLDERATDLVLSNIEMYAKEIGAGIVYISHESNVVERCDEVIQLVNLAKADKMEAVA